MIIPKGNLIDDMYYINTATSFPNEKINHLDMNLNIINNAIVIPPGFFQHNIYIQIKALIESNNLSKFDNLREIQICMFDALNNKVDDLHYFRAHLKSNNPLNLNATFFSKEPIEKHYTIKINVMQRKKKKNGDIINIMDKSDTYLCIYNFDWIIKKIY